MDEYVPPVRNWRWWTVTAMLVVVAGAGSYLSFAHTIDERIADGTAVPAEVTAMQSLPLGKTYQPQRVTVSYDLDGRRSVRLTAALKQGDYQVGDRLTVLVDPARPGRVATADGFASEGLLLLIPPAAIFYGLLAGLVIGVRRGRWWWQHERQAPTNVSLLTVTGSNEDDGVLPWEWLKEVRRLTAAAEEASKGQTAPLRLLIFVRLGVRGEPRVVWYSRRSRRLVVVGTIAPGALTTSPQGPLREVVGACVRLAERWSVRHRPGTDLSSLTRAAEMFSGPVS